MPPTGARSPTLVTTPRDGSAPAPLVQLPGVTHQNGVTQVPSISPDETEVLYLSDDGGHGNLWVASTGGSGARQLTFETDLAVSIGIPTWSPTSNQIAYFETRGGPF